MSRQYQTQYRPLDTEPLDVAETEEHELPPSENIIINTASDEVNHSRWNHLSDLDDFFTRIYHYVQRHGFWCMVLQDILQMLILWYVVIFPTFILVGVNFDVLFQDRFNMTYKVIISDAVLPWDKVQENFNPFLVIVLIITSVYLVFRSFKALFNITKYWEMRTFFTHALDIHPRELSNKTWHEVQGRLITVQKQLHMCVHKNELNELDVYHRILRFKNYMVAMVNKSVLPMKFFLPFWGEIVFFTSGLKYNYEMVLFWGPGAPFENNWHLRNEYKNINKRKELGALLSRRIFIIGVFNMLLAPVVFIWTLLYFFFENFAIFRNDPGLLGSRRWSLYGRHFLRHFNELDHDFNTRLNRGYRAAEKYMNLFWSPSLATIAQFIIVICSGFLAFLIICTVKDEDTLGVSGVIGIMTILGLVVTCARTLIPDENMVRMPETLMTSILCQIHYMTDTWKGQAHTYKVKDEFSQLFQYKLVYLLEEMLSAVVSPFILIFWLRPRSVEIVDFLRNFTITLEGVGDVCSFAQMDIKKHGHPDWTSTDRLEPGSPENRKLRAEFGKTELSLMHFTLTNPEWKVPEVENDFINNVRQNVNSMRKDYGGMMSMNPLNDNPLLTSSQALSVVGQPGYHSLTMSCMAPYGSEYNSMVFNNNIDGPPPPPLQPGTLHHHQQPHPHSYHRPTDLPLPTTTNTTQQGAGNSVSDVFSSTIYGSGFDGGESGGGGGGVVDGNDGGGGGTVRTWRATTTPNPGTTMTSIANDNYQPPNHSHHHQQQQHPNSLMHASIRDEGRLEMLANEMSYSALYLFEHHLQRRFDPMRLATSQQGQQQLQQQQQQQHHMLNFYSPQGGPATTSAGTSPPSSTNPNQRLSNIDEEEELNRQQLFNMEDGGGGGGGLFPSGV